jgi:type I restriction enzyme, S subunit
MSLSRYPEYKDSGVAWLGEVPARWAIKPFYSLAIERNEQNSGMLEDNLLSLSYGRIVRKNIESNDGLLPESFETYQIVKPGDIVFRLTDLQNDKRSLRTAIVAEQGIITSAYLAATPIGVQSGYLSYLLRAYDVTKVFYSMGGGLRQSMKFADIKRLPTLAPSTEEQAAIATFLDRETAKIDGLIAEQEKLIALLAEKRQATISHAVTKGLNPAAPMKDSGVAWLGEIPIHWKAARLKNIAFLIDGDRSSAYPSEQDFVDNGIPFLSSKDIINFMFSGEHLRFITDEKFQSLSRGKTQDRDLVITVRGTIGHVGIFDATKIGYPTAFINAQMMIIRPTQVSSEFLHMVMESYCWQQQLERASYGTAQQQLSNEVLSNITLTLPPPDEIASIAAFLESEITKLDELTAEATSGITLLKERRSALISAAVTGKIDVRHLAEAEAA